MRKLKIFIYYPPYSSHSADLHFSGEGWVESLRSLETGC